MRKEQIGEKVPSKAKLGQAKEKEKKIERELETGD